MMKNPLYLTMVLAGSALIFWSCETGYVPELSDTKSLDQERAVPALNGDWQYTHTRSVSLSPSDTDWINYDVVMWNDTGITQWITSVSGNFTLTSGLWEMSFYLVDPSGFFVFNGNHEFLAYCGNGSISGNIGQSFPGGILIPPGFGYVWQAGNRGPSGHLTLSITTNSTANPSGMSVQKFKRDVFTDYHLNPPTFPADGKYHLPIIGEGQAVDMNCTLKQVSAFVSFGGSNKPVDVDIVVYKITPQGQWVNIGQFPHQYKASNAPYFSPPPITLNHVFNPGDKFRMQAQAKSSGGGIVPINVSAYGYFMHN